jgi:hypothetical protein
VVGLEPRSAGPNRACSFRPRAPITLSTVSNLGSTLAEKAARSVTPDKPVSRASCRSPRRARTIWPNAAQIRQLSTGSCATHPKKYRTASLSGRPSASRAALAAWLTPDPAPPVCFAAARERSRAVWRPA